MWSFALAVSEPAVAAWLVRTSWQAVVLVAIVAAMQLVCGKLLTPPWRYALWMLVVVRLLMPVLPRSEWSVFNVAVPGVKEIAPVADVAEPHSADWTRVTIIKTFDAAVEPTPAEPAKVDVAAAPAPPLAPASFDWRRTLLAVWLAGAALLVLRLIIAHVLLTRRLRGAPPVNADVVALLDDCCRAMGVRGPVRAVATDAVGGPALFGFVRPRLLVPPDMLRELARDDLRFVFLHELAHLKRRDTLTNVPIALAGAVHWFNPAVWFALGRCRTERELACDAMVLGVTDSPRAREGYGQTMLRLAEALCAARGGRRPRAVSAALGILQTHSQLNRRITMISAFRRSPSSSRRWSILPALLLVSVASCALTDKPADEKSTQPAAVSQTRSADAAAPAAEPATDDAAEGVRKTAAQAQLGGIPAPAADDTPAVDVETARIHNLLDRRFPELKFDATPFDQVVDYLREKTDVDILVNWRRLEAEGIDRKAPVTAKLRDVKFAKALKTILDDLGGGTIELGYTIDDGIITITTAEEISRNTVTRVYDVRDLITTVPDYDPPSEHAGIIQAQQQPHPHPTTQPQASLAEQIMELIQETVDPEAWRDAGGTVGSIRELSGQFIITASPQMHEDIAKLLHQIREARGVQVNVEARFIAIPPALLDEALGGKLRDTLGKAGEPTVWQLSDEQVAAVLRGTQQAEESTILTAPRITLFNGQRAYVNVATETPYVAGFTIFKKDGGETRYEPKVDKISSGILLDVRATASADRRQAVLTLKPRLSRLEGLRPTPYMGAKDLSIQVPELVVHELQTTLSIPDRCTALIGGFTQSPPSANPVVTSVAADRITLEGHVTAVRTTVKVPDGGTLLLDGKPATQPVTLGVAPVSQAQNLYLLVKPTLILTRPQDGKGAGR